MAISKIKSAKTIHPFLKGVIAFLTIVSLYFLIIKAIPKLLVSETSYGDYYWYRASWLFTHNFCGIVALVVGPFQFIPSLRNKHWQLHHNLGKIYLICVGIASITSIYLSLTSAITVMYAAGLLVGSVVWFVTGFMAYWLIKQRKVQLHKQWMIRNYVVTFFFIIFFGFYDLFRAFGITDLVALASILPWVSLIVPLGVTEYILRKK